MLELVVLVLVASSIALGFASRVTDRRTGVEESRSLLRAAGGALFVVAWGLLRGSLGPVDALAYVLVAASALGSVHCLVAPWIKGALAA